ncbi:MAG: exodeoxyribonuclease VII large subunit [Bacteroidales bacterium]
MNTHSFITLEQLSQSINQCISSAFGSKRFWIVAEISNLNIRKGNCYLSLIDKAPGSVYPKAEFRGIIWRSHLSPILNKFKSTTKNDLKENMRILFRATLKYDNKFGMALYIEDIEPGYTLGQMEMDKQLAIKKLKQENIYHLNKSRIFPLVPQSLAVISNTDSKGFEDFKDKIDHNPWGYKYSYHLFPSLLQGEKAANNIRDKLIEIFTKIKNKEANYDIVLILRGGGGNTNLNCFNNYQLARAVARFPLPIITGIGHTTNISVIDEIAHTRKNTPTDVADYIIRQTREYDILISGFMQKILSQVNNIIPQEKKDILQARKNIIHFSEEFILNEKEKYKYLRKSISEKVKTLTQVEKENQKLLLQKIKDAGNRLISEEKNILNDKKNLFNWTTKSFLEKENIHLNNYLQKIKLLDPINTLKRGFSITYFNGKNITSTDDLKDGDIITSKLENGSLNSIVKK